MQWIGQPTGLRPQHCRHVRVPGLVIRLVNSRLHVLSVVVCSLRCRPPFHSILRSTLRLGIEFSGLSRSQRTSAVQFWRQHSNASANFPQLANNHCGKIVTSLSLFWNTTFELSLTSEQSLLWVTKVSKTRDWPVVCLSVKPRYAPWLLRNNTAESSPLTPICLRPPLPIHFCPEVAENAPSTFFPKFAGKFSLSATLVSDSSDLAQWFAVKGLLPLPRVNSIVWKYLRIND